MVREDPWYDLNFLKFTEVWFVTQDVVYPGECSMCTWEGVFFCIWMGCPEDINEIISSNVSFKTCVSLLIFCFDDLSIGVNGVLNSPIIMCYCQFLLLYLLVFVLSIEVLFCWVHRYLQLLCLPLGLIPWSLCSVLSYLLYSSLF